MNVAFNHRFAPLDPFPQHQEETNSAIREQQTANDPESARKYHHEALSRSRYLTTVTPAIQRKTHEIAQQYGCDYLNVHEMFYRHSPDGLTANGLFWDELHPNAAGHQYIADAILPWVEKQVLLKRK